MRRDTALHRAAIRERTLRAATIIAWLELPHDIAKTMSEDEIIGLVDYDHHPIRHADGGLDVHWNLRPMLRADHKVKTKFDAADMAKERKVRRAVNEHAQRMLLKSTPNPHGIGGAIGMWGRMRKQWPKRKFPTRRR
jgi:hypothetical protein